MILGIWSSSFGLPLIHKLKKMYMYMLPSSLNSHPGFVDLISSEVRCYNLLGDFCYPTNYSICSGILYIHAATSVPKLK